MNTTVGIVSKIVDNILMPVITVVFALTVLLFIWGVAGLILNKDDAGDKRHEAQNHILWGVVGMAIMLSSYGIIRFVASTLGVQSPF